jgi:hypothetical protein
VRECVAEGGGCVRLPAADEKMFGDSPDRSRTLVRNLLLQREVGGHSVRQAGYVVAHGF